MPVYIADSMMGSGKTSAAIQMMRNTEPSVKYLYITPYITEVDRIIAQCPERSFQQPDSLGTKTRAIKYLFEQRENIVATHALFQLFDSEITQIIRKSSYTLIMDEVADVIAPLGVGAEDMRTVLEKYATINPKTNLLEWHDKKYKGVFSDVKRLCEARCIGAYNDEVFVWLFPIKVFKAFADTYVLTYMFDAQLQRYYYDLHEVKYKRISVENRDNAYLFTDEIIDYDVPSRDMIRILDKSSLNNIGEHHAALSMAWYENHEDDIQRLRKNTYNYFANYAKTISTKTLWTTFKEWQHAIAGRGYMRGFAPLNARATNHFRDRTAVAYLVNRYMNPVIKHFLARYGVEVNEKAYGLCDMLQFIWRSAIRDGQPIDLYVPSRRMRTLLIDWLESDDGAYTL